MTALPFPARADAPSLPPGRGICSVCSGSGRVPLDEHNRPWAHVIAGADPATMTGRCLNCGGQTMASKALGHVPLRADGTPCAHEYAGHRAGNCYHVYRCVHCGDRYDIDSSD